jgi:hypothetical protein
MITATSGFLRNWILLAVTLVACVMTLGGCDKPFIARDVYFDNSADRGTETTRVVLVALSQDEWGSVERSAKTVTEREADFLAKMEGEWGGRVRPVELEGASERHLVLAKSDPLWKSLPKAKDQKGNPVVWCTLIVVSKNWKSGDRWAAAYRGAPADAISEDQPAVTFKWVTTVPGGAGAPICLSVQSPSGQ